MSATVTSVRTEYRITLDPPVILTDEHHYPYRDAHFIDETWRVTHAIVSLDTQYGERDTPYVTLRGWKLNKNGTDNKKHGEVTVHHTCVVTRLTQDADATFDSSAYEAVVAEVIHAVALEEGYAAVAE